MCISFCMSEWFLSECFAVMHVMCAFCPNAFWLHRVSVLQVLSEWFLVASCECCCMCESCMCCPLHFTFCMCFVSCCFPNNSFCCCMCCPLSGSCVR
ncbi:hypothetical protein CIPAW_01G053200 [Carya illinoinensis]|uniref:Secreted protein n=1 Tax=Carya illinoinensis TaxID=32201 RepID=A0A8T1RJD1_CARIL|nr:hypothetical protein CIPAW_01G053200 [Carya illinoinensis]